ncbi:MAG: DUF2608 domain-containing protein [Epsilonproteobacteria bacterium]|nr:DUF2608 domain-containing protein [Campylobacterota bacterium]
MKILHILLMLVMCFSGIACAVKRSHRKKSKIIQFSSYNDAEVASAVAKADGQTLVLFDVDDTLIHSPDAAANPAQYSPWFRIKLFFRFPQLLFERPRDECVSAIFAQAQRELIEQEAAQVVETFKAADSKVLGLTASWSGKYGSIDDAALMRTDMLKALGINFSDSFQDQWFTKLPKHKNVYPRLHSGILFANRQNKGNVLVSFLDQASYSPSRIIVFDDNKKELRKIRRACRKRNVECHLYNYRGAKLRSTPFKSSRALKQLRCLVREKRWLSDSEFDQYIESV